MESTSPSECPGCIKLRKEVEALKAQIQELVDRLNQNSSNSSRPPSSDPPWKKSLPKPPTGRKPGGQPGHTGFFRKRLPAKRINQVIHYVPESCQNCGADLPKKPQPSDPRPTWHQVAELPEIAAMVTEHRGHARTCKCCGHRTRAQIPTEILAHTIGPRLAAAMSFLSGRCNGSKRRVQEILQVLFNVPVALGTVVKHEQEMSSALRVAHAHAEHVVCSAPSKNIDETGWSKAGRQCWLWLAATRKTAYFKIDVSRGKKGLHRVLGCQPKGILTTDRWHAYSKQPLQARQICWAHLKRDFQKLVDWGNGAERTGTAGLAIVRRVFSVWRDFKELRISRVAMQRNLLAARRELKGILTRALRRLHAGRWKAARFSKRLLKCFSALWTFVENKHIEPTNNHAERLLRPAVLWRKNSLGSQSEGGCRFTERMLTVVHTLRLQGRDVFTYLHHALTASRLGRTIPTLISTRD